MNANAQSSEAFQEELPYSPSAGNVSSINNDRRYVRINAPRSDWASEIEASLNELTALPVGWDGYRGKPVKFSSAYFVARLLEELYDPRVSPPQIVPGSDGSLQIEWHKNGFDIEIDVLAPYQVLAYRYNCTTGGEEETQLVSDFSILRDWIRDIR